eukprot:SAG31_NODE_1222_length_9294_cov_4.099184_11_plen_182_part_00
MVTDPEFKCSRVILPSDEDNVSLDYGLLRAIYDSPYPERIFRVSTAMKCWPAYLETRCQTHPHDCCHRHQQTQIEKNRASTVDANFEKMCARFDWTEFGVCGFTSNVCIAAVRGRCVQQISILDCARLLHAFKTKSLRAWTQTARHAKTFARKTSATWQCWRTFAQSKRLRGWSVATTSQA